jgi:methylated-DNA-[protein]-cysteine S-methyltransferase
MTHCTAAVQKIVSSPLGDLRLLASPDGLSGVWFTHRQQHSPTPERLQDWPLVSAHPVLDAAKHQLDDYFRGRRISFDLPLDLQQGTAFQQSVWRALLGIPGGQTQSYGAIALHIGRPKAVRAVGAAIGRNPLGIVVPCHRVIGAGGSLTGYAGGLDRKQALLLLESSPPANQTPCLFN